MSLHLDDFNQAYHIAWAMDGKHPNDLYSQFSNCDDSQRQAYKFAREIVAQLRKCAPLEVPAGAADLESNDLDMLIKYSTWCQLANEAKRAGQHIPLTCWPARTVEDIDAEISDAEDFASLLALRWDRVKPC